jgi:hypothetical protein
MAKAPPRNLSQSRVSLSRRHTSILGEGKRLPNVPLDFSVLCLKDQKCAREKCSEITGFVTIDPGFGHRENKDLNRRLLTSLEVSLERLPAVCVAQHPHYLTVSQIVRHHCPLRQFANSVRPVRTMGKILIDPTKHTEADRGVESALRVLSSLLAYNVPQTPAIHVYYLYFVTKTEHTSFRYPSCVS